MVCGPLCSFRRQRIIRENNVSSLLHEIARGLRESSSIAFSKPDPDHEIFVLSIAQFSQAIAKAHDAGRRSPGIRQYSYMDGSVWFGSTGATSRRQSDE